MKITRISSLEVKEADGIQTWTMSFGPVNPLNPDFLAAMKTALEDATANEAVSAIVLTSGLRVFSAGGDTSWMKKQHAERGADGLLDEFNRIMNDFRKLCVAMRCSPLLIIASLNGHTLAGGLELAAACDLRFCANNDRIQIGVPEMDLFGVMPSGGGGAQFIGRLMGASRALQFILDAKPVGPKDALEMGLVDRLYDPESLLEKSEAFAKSVSKKAGRIGVSAAKRAILDGIELPLLSAMSLDRAIHWDAMRRGNFRTVVSSFIQRFGGAS